MKAARTNKRPIPIASIVLAAVTITALAGSLYWYGQGLQLSPLLNPDALAEKRYLQEFLENNDQDLQEEKLLAEGYWRRYRDVRADRYWGRGGPMGIWGARDHYRQHGRREGRIFKPLPEVVDLGREKELAEIYWARYPEIARNSIWGRNGQLGILGPRDYHTYRGRFQGKVWGDDVTGE